MTSGWLFARRRAILRDQSLPSDGSANQPISFAAGAADLVRLKVDVLFVSSAGLAKLLQLETKTIPIVVGRADEDLVAAGLVDSLAKPGGNITGHSS